MAYLSFEHCKISHVEDFCVYFFSPFTQKRLAEYTALTRALVHFSSRKEGNYVRRWSGELPPKAEKLLEFHAVLNDVDVLQQACV